MTRAQRASFEWKIKDAIARLQRRLAALASFSTTPLASFLDSSPLLSQEGKNRVAETFAGDVYQSSPNLVFQRFIMSGSRLMIPSTVTPSGPESSAIIRS